MAPSKSRRSKQTTKAATASSSSSATSRRASASVRPQKILAPKSTATPSTSHTPSHAALLQSLSIVAARARAALGGVQLYAEYRGIALLHPSQPETIFFAANASPQIRAALDRIQQEDREVHQRKKDKRSVPRVMRVRYCIIAAAPQLDGMLLTPLTHLINHTWGINDNAPTNKIFFGSDHVRMFPLHSGASKSGGAGQAMGGAGAIGFHADYIRDEAAKHISNGTPAEWAKHGNQRMHTCIRTMHRWISGDKTVHVQPIDIQLRADGTPILQGYPGSEAQPMIHAPIPTAAAIAKVATKKLASKKNSKSAAKRQPRSKCGAASVKSAAAPAPCKFSLRRAKAESAETIAHHSDSEDDDEEEEVDDHTDAASVLGGSSASVATGPPSPASPSSVSRFAAEVESIDEEGEEDEWEESSSIAKEKAPTEAASSMFVPAPSSPIMCAAAESSFPAWSPPPSWLPDPAVAAEWQEKQRAEGEEEPLHSLLSASSSSSSSLLLNVLSDRECAEREALDLNVSWRRSLQSLIDDDEQRELRRMMQIHGAAAMGSEQHPSSAAAAFESRWSPFSLQEPASSSDASSCLSPSSVFSAASVFSYPLVSNGLSDDDLHSCSMDDEEIKEAQQWSVMQLEQTQRRVASEAEAGEVESIAFQPNSVARRIFMHEDHRECMHDA